MGGFVTAKFGSLSRLASLASGVMPVLDAVLASRHVASINFQIATHMPTEKRFLDVVSNFFSL